jgi:carbon-monoxide dehydrogenase medium subunit
MQHLRRFEFFEPESIEEAAHVLSRYDRKQAMVLAGGIDLIPRMRRRLVQPECVVSLHRIPGLDYIEREKTGGVRIGPMTRLRSIELSSEIQSDYKVLHDAVRHVASVQVKTMGTAVGNLCVATPASDVALSLFVLDANLRVAGPASERTVGIEEFYTGLHQTLLQEDEIVVELLLPKPDTGISGAYRKLVRVATDVAKVNVAVMLRIRDGTCEKAKIALGSVAPTPFRAKRAEEILKGEKPEKTVIEAAAKAAADAAKPITDIRSTADYRKEMTQVLTRRALVEALKNLEA